MSLFCSDAFVSPLEVEAAVTRALEEDLGRAGDITSIATIPEDTKGRALVVARKPGVVSGLPLVEAAFRRLAPALEIKPHGRDGMAIGAGTKLMTIAGNARAILSAERTALNFIGHLSGIATATAAFVARIAHTKARIICTRQTAPVLKRAKAAIGHLVKIEIEVDSLDQLKEVLDVGLADVVLIDNFDLDAMRKAVAMVDGRLVIKASGGFT